MNSDRVFYRDEFCMDLSGERFSSYEEQSLSHFQLDGFFELRVGYPTSLYSYSSMASLYDTIAALDTLK